MSMISFFGIIITDFVCLKLCKISIIQYDNKFEQFHLTIWRVKATPTQ